MGDPETYTATEYPHVSIDDRGITKIVGNRIKVMHLVMARNCGNLTIDEVAEQFPHLPFSQVLAAFAYYYDHKERVDTQIDESVRYADEMRRNSGETPLRKKLREQGLISNLSENPSTAKGATGCFARKEGERSDVVHR